MSMHPSSDEPSQNRFCCCSSEFHSWGMFLSALLIVLPRISAQECQPLCWLDTQRTGRCQVSPVYMASLLNRLSPGSLWGDVAAQNLACRSLNTSACSSATCNLLEDGSCIMRSHWIARKLANSSSVATKCGALGKIMADEATCYELDRAACATFNLASCSWDLVRGVCGISPSHVLVLLRQDRISVYLACNRAKPTRISWGKLKSSHFHGCGDPHLWFTIGVPPFHWFSSHAILW